MSPRFVCRVTDWNREHKLSNSRKKRGEEIEEGEPFRSRNFTEAKVLDGIRRRNTYHCGRGVCVVLLCTGCSYICSRGCGVGLYTRLFLTEAWWGCTLSLKFHYVRGLIASHNYLLIFESGGAMGNFTMFVIMVKQTHQLGASNPRPRTSFCFLGNCSPRSYHWTTWSSRPSKMVDNLGLPPVILFWKINK